MSDVQAKDQVVNRRNWRVVPLVGLVVSGGLYLGAHYALESIVETSALAHTSQHVLIFLAGMGMGASGFSLIRPNHKHDR